MKKSSSAFPWILFFLFSFSVSGFPLFADEPPAVEPEPIPVEREMARLFRPEERPDVLSVEILYHGTWMLYSGKTQESVDMKNPVLTGHGPGFFALSGASTQRRYFALQTDVGRSVFAENPLPMAGGYNFRDLGGIRARAGKRVMWGFFFRGDSMEKLTQKDLAYLAEIPIRTVVDFRTEEEAGKAPDKLPCDATEHLALRINPGSLLAAVSEKRTAEEYEQMMLDMYRGMIRDEAVIQQYKKFFRLLQNEEKIPVLYHCSAGKDRTGLATALLLSALGVGRPRIMDDYLASNALLRKKYENLLKKHPEMEPLFAVKKDYLLAAFDEIEKSHESLEYFLRVVLDIDMGKLQKKYLYQAEYL